MDIISKLLCLNSNVSAWSMWHTDIQYRKVFIQDKYNFLIFYYINKSLSTKDIHQQFHSRSEGKHKICILHLIHMVFI